jgi:hypothetical protein
MRIKSISGAEPSREGEYPICWALGYDGVTRIEETTENFGTYGITWFEVFNEDKRIAKLNALHVASVTYQD